jgi:hypothetical protein
MTSLNGTTGAPSRGNPEHGAELFESMVAELARRLEVAKSESPPLPPEHWHPAPNAHTH